jgi:hypothetical protein
LPAIVDFALAIQHVGDAAGEAEEVRAAKKSGVTDGIDVQGNVARELFAAAVLVKKRRERVAS